MNEKGVAVLGMGVYGKKIAEALLAAGNDVIVADSDRERINSLTQKYTYAVSLDLGNADAVAELGLENVSVAVVDLEKNLEQAIICVMVAKEQGVEHIIATAPNKRFKEILRRMGATEVVIPEEEAAMRMAGALISDGFMEYFDIGKELCIIRIHPLQAWIGKTIASLKLREKLKASIVAVEEDGEFVTNYDRNVPLSAKTEMLIGISKKDLMDYIED